MILPISKHSTGIVLLGVVLSAAVPARGAGIFDGDWWQATLELGASSDSNPLRVSGEEEATEILGDRSVAGHGHRVRAFVDFGWDFGLQRVRVDGAVAQTSTDDGGVLDHTDTDIGARWLWAIGPHWHGELGARRFDDLSPIEALQLFSDTGEDVAGLIRDPRFQDRFDASVIYRYHPTWHVRIEAVRHVVQYELDVRKPYGNQQDVLRLAWNHQPRENGSTAGLRASTIEVSFNEPLPVTESLSTPRYRESEARFVVDWLASHRSRLGGYGGYLVRRYDGLEDWDQQGPVGRLYARWNPGVRSTLEISVHRQMKTFLEIETPSMVETGVAMTALWRPSSRLELKVSAERLRADFVATSSGIDERRDDWGGWTTQAVYALHPSVELSVSATSVRRTSTAVQAGYDSVGGWAGLRLRI